MSVSYISGKLVSESFIGKLSSLTYKCYSVSGGCIIPALDAGEQSIYSLLFQSDFYNKQVSQYLGAAGVKKVVSVKEGDSSIQLVNSNEQAKTIRGLAKDYYEQAKEMADLYNRGLATAKDVKLYTIDPYRASTNVGDNFGFADTYR